MNVDHSHTHRHDLKQTHKSHDGDASSSCAHRHATCQSSENTSFIRSFFMMVWQPHHHEFTPQVLDKSDQINAKSMSPSIRLVIAAVIILTFCVVEFIGSFLTNSLALFADALHMLTDGIAISIALCAHLLAHKQSKTNKQKTEAIAGLFNGLLMAGLIMWLLYEALQRLSHPHEIVSLPMLIIAVIGLIANLAAFYVLHPNAQMNVNMRGAILHIVGDILGSIAAIIAAIVIWFTGWVTVDTLLTLLVSVLLIRSTYDLLRRSWQSLQMA